MAILKDFECPKCKRSFEELVVSGEHSTTCPKCGTNSPVIYLSTALVTGCDSFNPHYDIQLGKHFSSASEKKKHLERTGKVQESGHLSPKRPGKGRVLCSSSQFKRMEKNGGVERYIKNV